MELDEATRADLAAFFARRFPGRDVRTRVAGGAGLPAADLPPEPRAAWDVLVGRAVTAGRMRALLDAANAAAPGDPNLLELTKLVTGGDTPRPDRRPLLLALGLGGALALAGLGYVVGRLGEGPATAPPPASLAAAPAVSTNTPTPATPASTEEPQLAPEPVEDAPAEAPAPPAIEPGADEPAPAAARIEAASPPVAPVVTPAAATPSAEPLAAQRSVPSGCRAETGTIVGWWYLSRGKPGDVGDTITVPTNANVRADFPRAENNFARGATVLCTLKEGTRQRLSRAPVPVGGGKWWVPVVGGDLGG